MARGRRQVSGSLSEPVGWRRHVWGENEETQRQLHLREVIASKKKENST